MNDTTTDRRQRGGPGPERPSLVAALHALAGVGPGAPSGRHVTLDVWPDATSPTGKRWLLLWTELAAESQVDKGALVAEVGASGTASSPWLEAVLQRAQEVMG